MRRWLVLLGILVGALPAWGRSPHAADHKKPTITITTPTSATTYATTATPLTVGGTASDNVGVTQVTVVHAPGGSVPVQGTTSWSASVPLTLGSNVITVTAHDAAGNTSTDTLTVTLMAQPGPITVEWSYDPTLGGDSFTMQRCTITSTCPCTTMADVAAMAIGDRSWTDTAVAPTADYAYRMAVVVGGVAGTFDQGAFMPGTYSSTMCSP